ncbi:MAG: Unknown protein [uncultured Thiotrichaceae bacterium]|uniref:HupH hydrogenase expression protein C-terminal domain-containing protein n=1 Tax=uncultured Thiotrichaceae bacterium TaxID=298394 RepID=A0A6S6TYJ7_9GAMM|nr:MAG: Unknown protein [uncultured Thiotrichaceae bacterium]
MSNVNTCASLDTGNDILILHEIRHALRKLLDDGESTIIDLRAIPMAPGEEARIEAMLGQGELSATLNALGKSTINETAFSGAWLITHYNTEDEILGKFIEISKLPSILASQHEDIEVALEQLTHQLLV